MGQGVKIILVNKTPYRWKRGAISSYQLDAWDHSFPDVIEPATAVSLYVEFHKGPFTTESDDQAWVTYQLEGTNGPLQFKLHGVYSDEAEIDVELVGFMPIGNGFSSRLGKERKEYFVETEELRVNLGLVGNEGDGFLYFAKEQGNPSWMKFLNGEKLISEFTIPGTHDTLTYGLNKGLIDNLPNDVLQELLILFGALGFTGAITTEVILHITQCQRLSLAEQLNKGIRFLDIRLKIDGDKLEAYHGGIRLHINFDEVLAICYNFLSINSSETIIMSVKDESEKNDQAFSDAVYRRISGQPQWFTENRLPQLNEVRNKLVLFRRFQNYQPETENSTPEKGDFGINAYDEWPGNGTGTLNEGVYIKVQDAYKSYVLGGLDKKFNDHAKSLLAEAAGDTDKTHLYVNFMSGTGGVYPETVANGYMSQFIGTNGLLFDYVTLTTQRKFGILPMDFPETPFAGILPAQLIMQNEFSLLSAFNREINVTDHYQIRPLYNLQKNVDVKKGKADPGTEVIIYDVNGGDNQKWQLEDAGGGFFYIHPLIAPTMVLDVKEGSTENQSPVVIFENHQADNQKWRVTDHGNGRFRISPKHAPDMALKLYNFDSGNGKQLVIYTFSEGDLASEWEFVKV